MAVANSTLYILHSTLRIEVLFKGLELIFAEYAALPPRLDETKSVAHQLREGGRDAEEADLEAAALSGGVNQDDEAVEQDGSQCSHDHPVP